MLSLEVIGRRIIEDSNRRFKMLTRNDPQFPRFFRWLVEECFDADQLLDVVERPAKWSKEFGEWQATLAAKPTGWVYEDELLCDVTLEVFAKSRLIDGVRMYPESVCQKPTMLPDEGVEEQTRGLPHNEPGPAIEALQAIVNNPDGCPFCDSGKLRTPNNPAKGHTETCGFAMAEDVLKKAGK